MREKIQKNKHIIFMILSGIIVLAICLCIYLLEIRPKASSATYDTKFNNEEFDYEEKSITDKDLVSQTFKHKSNISGIKIGIKYSDTNLKGNLFVKLYDEDKDVIVGEWKYTFDGNKTFYNSEDGYFALNLIDDSSCILSPGIYSGGNGYTNYKVEISSDVNDEKNAPTIYFSKMKVNDEGNLCINNKNIEGDLYLKVTSTGAYLISKLFIALTFIFILLIMISYYVIFIKKAKIRNVFCVEAIIIGIIYMIIMTPYSVSDEYGHITTAYRYSNVLLGKGYQTENGNMLKRKCDLREYSLDTKPSIGTYYGVVNHFFDKLSNSDEELIEVPGDHIGNFWQYVPTAIGITFARIFNLGYIPLIYFGRIFNLLFFVFMIYLGIRKLPFGKITLFTVSMMPMAIHQGMSFSYDAIVYAWSFIFISYVINIAFTKGKIKALDIGIIILSAGILSTCKAGIFVFLCLVCLIIPKERFKSKKKYFAVIAGIMLAAICMLFIFNSVKVSKAVTMTTNDNLQNFQGIRGYVYSDIIKSPGMFISIVYNTIKINTDFYILSTIGGYLSWSTVNPVKVSTIIIICYVVVLILSALKSSEEDVYIKIKEKIIFSIVCLLIFGAFIVVAFTWTPYGNKIVFGIQGRYFMTFLPLIAFLFRNNIVVLKRNMNKEIMITMCFLQIITLLNIFANITAN